ncbi:MAG: S-adenosylmethionine decarboxylase, partial [Candidatus Komeilibacteria bacterium]|nr:S-adenosylmethionine decarboxylase [Candidatus Komeilibacteria bacterium]
MRSETYRAMDNAHFSSSSISREDYEAKSAWGLLASINLYGCNKEKITTPAVFRDFLNALTKEIDMKAYGEPLIEKFAEGHLEGYSVLQFIETSSITIHFDDKIGDRAFIDIFSCKYFDADKALAFCKNYFEAK